jgi:hypothetical protein
MTKITWFIILFFSTFVLTFILYSVVGNTAPPILIDKQTGKYLGNLNTNQYDPNSTSNPYGKYGSEYSADSINSPYGKYGSEYSNDSSNNPYATNSPAIIDSDGY